MKENRSVLIPDGESHILIHVVNCLAQIKGLKIYVMSNMKYLPMRYSRYIHHYSYYPKAETDTEWIANINKELERFSIDLVMPIFETGIRTVIKYQNLITPQNKLGLLPALTNFNTAINKGLLDAHLVKHELPRPVSVIVEPGQAYNTSKITYPALVKPMEGFGGGQGIHVFKDKTALKHYFDTNAFTYSYLIQDYIEGYDIDCSVLCKDGEILAYTIQKGNLMGKSKFKPQVGLEFVEEPKLYEVVKKLMESLNWSGVAHIDMRYDKQDNQFKVIEVNTRFWVSLDASLIANVNFPHLYCLASQGKRFEMPKCKRVTYLNLKGVVKCVRKNIGFMFRITYLLQQTSLKFAVKDPVPMLYKIISRTKNKILY